MTYCAAINASRTYRNALGLSREAIRQMEKWDATASGRKNATDLIAGSHVLGALPAFPPDRLRLGNAALASQLRFDILRRLALANHFLATALQEIIDRFDANPDLRIF